MGGESILRLFATRTLTARRCGTPSDERFLSAFQKRSFFLHRLPEDPAKVTVASGVEQKFRRQSVLDGLFSFLFIYSLGR